MLVHALTGSHDRQQFDCARPELNDWLRKIARQHQDKGLSKTFVATRDDDPVRISAYYALTLSELENRHLPDIWRKKLPSRIPGIRLGRLAVAVHDQGHGLGEMMLIDAMTRARRIIDQAGGVGLFVDAIDDKAAAFYLRYGFAAAPDQPHMLFLPLQVMP